MVAISSSDFQISRWMDDWSLVAVSTPHTQTLTHSDTLTHKDSNFASRQIYLHRKFIHSSRFTKFGCFLTTLSVWWGRYSAYFFFREKISTRFGIFSKGKRGERVVGYFLMRHGPLQGRASLQRNFWSRSNSIAGCTRTHATIIWYGARKMGRLISELCSLPVQLLNEVWKLIIVNK